MPVAYQRAVVWLSILLASSVTGASLWLATRNQDVTTPGVNAATGQQVLPAQAERFTCPMHPHIVQNHSGTCPICGMALVPANDNASAHINVNAAMQQTLGVRVAPVKSRIVSRNIETYGKVVFDQRNIVYITPKFEGWIRKLYVKAAGERVHEGEVLYDLYSAELVARQGEYLKLQDRRRQLLKMVPQVEGQESDLVMDLIKERTRARTRMVYEDIDPQTLRELEDLNQPLLIVPIRAPKDGIVTDIEAREGSFVAPEGKVLTLVGLDNVWLDIVLFEDQLAAVKSGDKLTASFPALGGLSIEGELTWISPVLDETSRTTLARFELTNDGGRLRPGMYADVVVETQKDRRLAVPRSAVLRSGKGNYVMRHDGAGQFFPTRVSIGIESDSWTEITDGLSENDEVATNGQFLLSAEASLADAREGMASGAAASEASGSAP